MEFLEPKISTFIQELMPESTDEEQKEAQNNLIKYINLMERILHRIKSEKQKEP